MPGPARKDVEMTQFTSDAEIIVLCGRDTAQRPDLAEKAAEKGASIAETYTFETGDVASNDDLTQVSEVVTALKRAIETRRDVWAPFPAADIGREQHLRRLSLVLQRHGLDLLLGRELAASPTSGGFSAVDHALRVEVHAVDDLDQTVLAAAGVTMLGMEIERALTSADEVADAPAIPEVAEQSVEANAGGEALRQVGPVVLLGDAKQHVHSSRRDRHRADSLWHESQVAFHDTATPRDGTVMVPARELERERT